MTDSMIDSFVNDAAGIDANFQERVASINGDRLLSPEGKAKDIAWAKGKRDEALVDIQRRATAHMEARRSKAERAYAEAQRKAAQRRREVLGDALTAQLMREEISQLEPGEVVELVTNAPDEWHAEVARSFAMIDLQRRDGMESAVALVELRQLVNDDELKAARAAVRDVAADELKLARLNPDAYRASMADALGVNPRYVTIN